jgi:four helix bundle protein
VEGTDGVIRNYDDLLVWKKARAIVKAVYEVTRTFPAEELYGLTQQLRRAAVSVPSNIAEGYGRGSRKDYVRFLRTARGSLYEMQTQLLVAQDLGYVDRKRVDGLMKEMAQCSQVLHGLLRSLAKPKADKRGNK